MDSQHASARSLPANPSLFSTLIEKKFRTSQWSAFDDYASIEVGKLDDLLRVLESKTDRKVKVRAQLFNKSITALYH